uniref:Ribonuclease H-like domain-containing protein n=1 Tax=Tanacetum cinerariifolium TaxID=118510 RepID=A0A6L2JFN0_TANCI|nr:ribonuclease H-like domain-containing protein [Tanacetum cinerariifolium]
MAGSDNESHNASVHNEATNTQQQPNIQPQIITIDSNNNAKFPYLKKDEYEVWAMKMEYWITNNDMNIWKVIQNGNNMKRTGRYCDGRVIILPPTTVEEHIVVQRESKARTTLLQSIPDDHVADFHYMDDAKDIWNAVKARFGGNAKSKKMRKSMPKQEFSKFKIEDEDINLKFLRVLPSSWSQLKTLEVDIKGYSTFSSSQSVGPSHSAFVSATSASKKISYGDSPNYSSTTTYSVPSNPKTGSHRSGNVIEDVLHLFVADTEPEQQLAYEDLKQIEKLDLEEMGLKWQMAMLSVRVHKFEQKARRKIDFDKKESARFNKKKVRCYKCQQRGHFARECRGKGGNDKQRYSSFKIKEVGKKEEDLKALITVDTLVDWTDHDGESDGVIASKEFGMIDGYDTDDAIEEGAAKIYNLITGADTEEASIAGDAGEVALMGVTFEVHNCPFGCESKYNELHKQYNELNEQNGIPLFYRFAKSDSTKVVPPPLFGDYTSLSNHSNLDESQMSYGTKSSTSSDSKSVSNDFVSCDDSDNSSKVNIDDFASSDSSVKSLEPKPNDSTSCALTSSDLPSFSCNSSDKNENTSRTSCNKNGYFNKRQDCDFYEKQIVNKTIGIRVGPVHSRNKVNHPNQFVPQAVLLRTGKVTIPLARLQPVPTGKPKVFALVPAGRQNRPFLVPTDRGYSPSVSSDWWKSTARPMPHFSRPTSSYFQTYTPFVPTMSCNHMKYSGYRWATSLKPSACCSWKTHRKGSYWVPKNNSGSHIDDNVADLLTKAFDGPSLMVQDGRLVLFKCFTWTRVFNSPMLHLLRVEMVINSPWVMPILGTKELASPEQTAPDTAFYKDITPIYADFSSILVKPQSSRYVVPVGRVVVPTGRYVVPAGNVIVVSAGRLSVIPTGRVLSPGKNEIVIPG